MAIFNRIESAGVTIILTTHYLEEAENLCRHIAIIDRGKIVANTSMATILRQLNKERFIFTYKNLMINYLQLKVINLSL